MTHFELQKERSFKKKGLSPTGFVSEKEGFSPTRSQLKKVSDRTVLLAQLKKMSNRTVPFDT